MSKERLKEIQEKYDMWADDYNLDPQDVECLIKQAKLGIVQQEQFHDYQTKNLRLQKRVQELEVWRNEVTQNVVARNAEYAKCREQNKRYREALEFYANEENYFFDEKEYKVGLGVPESEITLDYGNKARKALKGE